MLSLASCDLSESPYGFYSENNFYKTEADAEAAVNYIYDAITYIEFSRAIVFWEICRLMCLIPKQVQLKTTTNNWMNGNWKASRVILLLEISISIAILPLTVQMQ